VAVVSAGQYASLHLIPENHANIPPLSFLQAGCPSCRPTNSVKALKAKALKAVGTTTYQNGYISSCVQNSILHGSETWPVRKENQMAFQWIDGCVMLR